jgi:hypothetical protein
MLPASCVVCLLQYENGQRSNCERRQTMSFPKLLGFPAGVSPFPWVPTGGNTLSVCAAFSFFDVILPHATIALCPSLHAAHMQERGLTRFLLRSAFF